MVRVCDRHRPEQGSRRFRRGRLDDAIDVPLHQLHVVCGAGRRHSEHLARIQDSSLYTGAAEPVLHRCLALFGAAPGATDLCHGDCRIRRRPAAGGDPDSCPDQDRHAATAVDQPGHRPVGRRRAARAAKNGTGRVCRVGRTDQPDDQYQHRLAPGRRQHFLAVLRGPPDGVSNRHAGRGPGYHLAAQPVESQCRWRQDGILILAGLGPAPDLFAGPAGSRRHGHPGHAADRHPFPLW